MNIASAPRDDQGLVEYHAQRAGTGLVPRTSAVRQYPAIRPDVRYGPSQPVYALPRDTAPPLAAVTGWCGPERRWRRVPVLLDTRIPAACVIDLHV